MSQFALHFKENLISVAPVLKSYPLKPFPEISSLCILSTQAVFII